MEPNPLDNADPGAVVVINDRGEETIVDLEDVAFVLNNGWRTDNKGYITRGYRRNGKYHKVYLHREILLWHGWKLPKGHQVDHRNRIKNDNRKANLRVATRSQNQSNRISDSKRSRFKGVTLNRKTGLYEARIQMEGRSLFLGSFPDDRLAAYYYNEAAKQIHGEFAMLNDLDDLRPKM